MLPATNALAAAGDEQGLPNVDLRRPAVTPVPSRTRDARASFARRLGEYGAVRTDRGSGGVDFVGRTDDLLTGPSDDPPTRIALDYVRDHGEIFGLEKADFDNLELVARSTSPDGITHLRFNQVLDGIASYDSGIDAHVTDDGRLINISGAPVPGAELPAGGAALAAQGGLGAARAAVRGSGLAPRTTGTDSGPDRATTFATGERSVLRWVATSGGPQLVWNVTAEGGDGHHYDVLVDASRGDLVARTDLTHNIGQVNWFPDDPESGVETTAMPGAWYDDHDGGVRLWGKYARTYTDPSDQDPTRGLELGGARFQVAASGGAPASPDWLFDQQTSLDVPNPFPAAAPCRASGCTWAAPTRSTAEVNQSQAAVNAHVVTSRFHDHLAAGPIGFDVASGNFERAAAPGAALAEGDDYVQVEVNDGQGFNNANFYTPSDGAPPRMQMYLWTAESVNGSDTADIIYHEYGHGLSNRLVVTAGGTTSLTAFQSTAMGEAWSDFYGLDLLVADGERTDTPATPGELLLAPYATASAGIRAKAIDCPVDPASVTVRCNGNGTATTVTGGYTYDDLGVTSNSSPHNGGEIWGETLWDIRTDLIAQLGPAAGREATLALITGGMRLSGDAPSMLDMRDAILQQAVAMRTAPGAADDLYDELWAAFAERGMGVGATSPTANSTGGVTEDFTVPATTNTLRHRGTKLVDPYPAGDNDGVIEPGERFAVETTLQGIGSNDLPGVAGTLTSGAGATVLDDTAAWPVLGRGRIATSTDALTAEMQAGCDAPVPLTVDITSTQGTVTANATADPRPGSSRIVRLNDFYAAPGVAEATFQVPDGGTITDVDLRIDELRHTWIGDLKIELLHGAKTITVVNRPGGANNSADDIVNAVFDADTGATVPTSGTTTLNTRYKVADMEQFEGDPAGGAWTLRITDNFLGDTGYLAKWGLTSPEVPCPRVEIPAATTGAASGVAATAATVAGTVTPNGRATGLRFAYGTTTAYGATTPVEDVGGGDTAVGRAAGLTGLAPSTTYHYRVEAIRENGQVAVAGSDGTFTTPAVPVPPAPPTGTTTAPALTPPQITPPRPLVSGLRVTLGKATRKGRKRATVAFALNTPAPVTITVTRAVKGTRIGSRCGPKQRRGRSCTRQVQAERKTIRRAPAGAQKVALSATGLRKGAYTVTVAAAGAARPATTTFTVR